MQILEKEVVDKHFDCSIKTHATIRFAFVAAGYKFQVSNGKCLFMMINLLLLLHHQKQSISLIMMQVHLRFNLK